MRITPWHLGHQSESTSYTLRIIAAQPRRGYDRVSLKEREECWPARVNQGEKTSTDVDARPGEWKALLTLGERLKNVSRTLFSALSSLGIMITVDGVGFNSPIRQLDDSLRPL